MQLSSSLPIPQTSLISVMFRAGRESDSRSVAGPLFQEVVQPL